MPASLTGQPPCDSGHMNTVLTPFREFTMQCPLVYRIVTVPAIYEVRREDRLIIPLRLHRQASSYIEVNIDK